MLKKKQSLNKHMDKNIETSHRHLVRVHVYFNLDYCYDKNVNGYDNQLQTKWDRNIYAIIKKSLNSQCVKLSKINQSINK